jgi:hypothetical protein
MGQAAAHLIRDPLKTKFPPEKYKYHSSQKTLIRAAYTTILLTVNVITGWGTFIGLQSGSPH